MVDTNNTDAHLGVTGENLNNGVVAEQFRTTRSGRTVKTPVRFNEFVY